MRSRSGRNKKVDIGQFLWLKFPELRGKWGEAFLDLSLEFPTMLTPTFRGVCIQKHKKTAILKLCRF